MRELRNSLKAVLLALCLSAPVWACAQERNITLELDAETEALRPGLEAAIAPLAETIDSDAQARRDAADAVVRMTDYLNSEAYFDPTLEVVDRHDVAAEPAGAQEPSGGVTISVSAGRRFVLASVTLDAGGLAADRLEQASILKVGDPALPASIRAEELRLAQLLQSEGFAFARVLAREAEGDRARATIDLTLRFETGPRVRLGDVIFPESLGQPPRFLERLVPFETASVYSPASLADLNDSLAETGLYRLASPKLSPDGRAQADGTVVHDVIVTAFERAPHTLSAGASYATSEGVGVTGEWIYRNAARRGDTLVTSAVIAPQQRTLEAQWRLPNAAGRTRSLVFGAAGGREETDGYDRNFLTLDGGLETRRNERNRNRYGASLELTRETPIGSARAQTDLYDLMIASVSASAVRDRTDRLLDPSTGWRADLRLEPGVVFGDASATYVHTVGQVSTYRSLGDDETFVGALRARMGVTSGAGAVDLPTSRRFYAGGGGSVRGYAFQEIGPKDLEGRPLGGRALAEASAELRWRRDGRWDGAAFVDAGSVSARDVPDFSDVKVGAGFGVIYKTPAGPLRADVAWPLQDGAEFGDVKVYLSLGQAF